MFCPKCATNNVDGASFCRGCGANISLVPQALTGQIASSPEAEIEDKRGLRRKHRKDHELTLDHAFKKVFMGIAFFIVAIALSRSTGAGWWFWLLLPAFSLMGQGIAQYIRLKEREKHAPLAAPPVQRTFPEGTNTQVLMPPAPSVTEGTTRHLNTKEHQ